MAKKQDSADPGATSFQSITETIENLLQRLDDPETNLEDSLRHFEQGIALVRQAQQMLSEAEQKVALLTASADGEPQVAGIDGEDEP
ncbi:MAG: exodeoxyribonuclease VII small subunit [Halioglobus sp.]|nr:exodeoxyribonuclease VII small subunit [Halioglobus sp.]